MEPKKLTKKEKAGQKIILAQIDNALSMLERHLKKYCEEVAPAMTGQKSTLVPMQYITVSIELLKRNMYEGAGIKRPGHSTTPPPDANTQHTQDGEAATPQH